MWSGVRRDEALPLAGTRVGRPLRVGLLAPWPVHYYAPLYRLIAADPRVDFTALFASSVGLRPGNLGYGTPVQWDTDPVEGYESVFLKRAEKNPPHGSFLSLHDWDIVETIRNRKFDVLWLHGYSYLTHSMAVLAQRGQGGAVLIREDQTLLSPRPPWKQAAKQIGLPLLFRGCYGLYVGTENRRWFERYGFPAERLFFVPHSVDNARLRGEFARLAQEKYRLRRKFGIQDDAGPVILSVMRLAPMKQPLLLIEAFARLRATTACVLLIAGSGPLERELRAVVAQREIPDVVFSGFLSQSEISGAYAAADVFTLCSGWNETWGLAVNEAMNFSLPAVLSDKVGCATDLIQVGRNGFIVPHDRPDELVESLAVLVKSREIRLAFGAASADIIEGWNYRVAAEGLFRALAATGRGSLWPEPERT
jgi:glycosyltransferase involved in cell wall biosynthesis